MPILNEECKYSLVIQDLSTHFVLFMRVNVCSRIKVELNNVNTSIRIDSFFIFGKSLGSFHMQF